MELKKIFHCVDEKGNHFWYLNGLKHRENDLPAIELNDGTKEWWVYGELHREDGPAVILPNGQEQWWKKGIYLDFSELKSQIEQETFLSPEKAFLLKLSQLL